MFWFGDRLDFAKDRYQEEIGKNQLAAFPLNPVLLSLPGLRVDSTLELQLPAGLAARGVRPVLRRECG